MKKKKKRILVISLCILLFLIFLVLPFGLTLFIYQSNFGSRYETIGWMARSLEEFDSLQAQRYTFSSDQGQMLTGYKYYKENEAAKGIVVIAHGLGGGGHNSYMDVADYLASNGYLVFAYDATGNDESGGTSVSGLPQGVIDLDHAIRFVEENGDFGNLPVMLFGHSWGAYSSGSVLNIHPEVKAVVMVAGFNKSLDIIEEEGARIMGEGISVLMPYFSVLERIKFGKYASYNCMDGFLASGAGVMMIQSEDDEMISFENQFSVFQEAYQDHPDFTFIPFKDRGHNYVCYSETSRQYRLALNQDFADFVAELDTPLTEEIKSEYMYEHLDKVKLYELDENLMNTIVSFYDKYAART